MLLSFMKSTNKKISRSFFLKSTDVVARELLGKIICRKVLSYEGEKILRARIVETEAYFNEKDPASRASKKNDIVGERMGMEGGKILVYNVHMYRMFNLVTGQKGKKGAVLLRALEPLNFVSRCSGPGLLSMALEINKFLEGEDIATSNVVWIEEDKEVFKGKIGRSHRVGVSKDLKEKYRFYIKDSLCVSKARIKI
jgi:DNA-3-methyladenine glycosylase